MLSLSVSKLRDEAEGPKKKLTCYRGGEDCRSRVSRCPGGTVLYLEFLCTHVQIFLELKSAAPLPPRVGALLAACLRCCCCCCCPFAPRWTTGRPTNRRHLVMTPTDREADDCDYCEEGKAKMDGTYETKIAIADQLIMVIHDDHGQSSSQSWSWLCLSSAPGPRTKIL